MTATAQPKRRSPFLGSSAAILRAAAGGVRDLWLAIGIAVVLFLGLEGLYRVQKAIRTTRPARSRPAVDSTLHPYANEKWWGPFQGPDGHEARDNRFDQYRGYLAGPASSRYLNIDSAGRRLTPQAPRSGPGPVRQVFMLGGSTMWGYTARDSFTIPALLARELHDRGVTDFEVVSLAQVGYNTTQDAITLLLELDHGRVPAAVIALDGFNDIATAEEYGGAGHTYGEAVVARQITRGRRQFWGELTGLGRHSALILGLRRKIGLDEPAAAPRPPADILCAEVAQYYRGNALAKDAMGRAWGFPVIHFLQPFHSASHKTPSAWERTLRRREVHMQCAVAIEAAMAADPDAARFVSLTGVFDADTATVFVDSYSHVTEAANRQIAARIASELVPLLRRPGPAAH